VNGFTTDGLGVIPRTGGDVDNVVRKLAWEDAHPGGAIILDDPRIFLYAARWPDGTRGASAVGRLGDLMGKLDRIEAGGRCPVHGKPGADLSAADR
jgi:hypothetical protein